VTRRNLVATDTESGTLGYAESETVYDRLSGTITSLPSVGQVIRPGQSLYRVDDKPVVLFDGSTPAFRDLASGVSDGPDVYELNRDLVRLGFDTEHLITIDDVWQAGTTDAVDLWQASLGEPETGIVTLGQIVFLPGAQRITAVDTVLGSTGQSAGGAASGSGSGAASSAATPVVPRSEFVGLKTTMPGGGSRRGATAGDSAAVLSALQALLKAETAEQKSKGKAPANAGGSGASKNSGSSSGDAAPAQAVLETASTKLVVSVQLNATMQSEAVVGERVSVELPDGSTVGGRVTQVSAVAQSSSSSANSGGNGGGGGSSGAPAATIPVTVALTGRHRSVAGLDQAAVSVNFVQQQARHVLSVPVTALLAIAGGGYDVQEAEPPHRLLPVTPGLFAAGYVQVSGTGIFDGLQVTDSQG
jgi:hypothetical protein